MSFMDSYKKLEKLCGDVLNDDRRVSAYIDEMINTPNGRHHVNGWDEDLKQLKHYRWIRNKIAHDPECTESNMCSKSDTKWINDFYSRIINKTDPLAIYRRSKKSHSLHTVKKKSRKVKKKKNCSLACFISVVIVLLIIVALVTALIQIKLLG